MAGDQVALRSDETTFSRPTPESARPLRFWTPTVLRVAVGLVAVVGLLLRLYVLFRQPINADEAVVGLMAREILHGHFFAFYWGQAYGGGEPYVVALMFALFGQSSFTLGFVPVLLDATCALLVWRIGQRLFSPAVGVIAACVFWIWPEVYVWQSTLEYGFRWLCLLCCLVLTLFALRIADDEGDNLVDFVVFGAFAGLGWWCSPEVVYYLLPAVLYLVYRYACRRSLPRIGEVGLVAGSFALAALPWLWANVRSGLASLHHGAQPGPGIKHHLNIEQLHVVPIALGIELRISGKWLFGSLGGHVVEFGLVALGICYALVLLARRQALVLVVFLVLFPFVYAVSPFTWFWEDGRYAVYLAPALALFFAGGIAEVATIVAHRHKGLAASLGPCLVALCLCLTLLAASELAPYVPAANTPGRASVTSMTTDPTGSVAALAKGLERHGLDDLYAGYWVAYVLSFESRGGIVATDARAAYARYRPYLAQVGSTKGAGWLFVEDGKRRRAEEMTGASLVDPGCAVKGDRCLLAPELESYLTKRHISYRRVVVSPFVAVVPSQPVNAKSVLSTFHILPS